MALIIPNKLRTTCVRSLSESMDVRTMTHMIRELFPGYDIYARTGFPESIAIPNLDVAKQIIDDVIAADLFPTFTAMLIQAQEEGLMGRKYNISYLRDIVKGTFEQGFIFDQVNRLFVEDPKVRHSRNWSVLKPNVEYTIAFLAIDIVGNTKLVRTHSKDVIRATYQDLRDLVQGCIGKRNGRIWDWEGDGGIVAFFFGNRNLSAVLSSMEILHELYIYNKTRCSLNEPLSVRIGVHSGSCEYTDNLEYLKKTDIVKETAALQEKGKSDTVGISIVVKVMLDEIISQKFKTVGNSKNGPFSYRLELE